jgi:hypothetical protein
MTHYSARQAGARTARAICAIPFMLAWKTPTARHWHESVYLWVNSSQGCPCRRGPGGTRPCRLDHSSLTHSLDSAGPTYVRSDKPSSQPRWQGRMYVHLYVPDAAGNFWRDDTLSVSGGFSQIVIWKVLCKVQFRTDHPNPCLQIRSMPTNV